jgi:pyruvate dehydrogenase E2 component (dihydrolipoamide acetyltransferase)
MIEVIMPKMGDGMEEGTLLEWLKKEGDAVKSGEVIGNIQTDKATLELESPGSGILSGILIQPGESVPVGKPIAALLKEGESLPANWGKAGGSEAKAETEQPKTESKTEDASAPAATTTATSSETRIKASPLAKKLAAEKGIDLSTIQGSGPGGRIVEKDLVSAKPSTSTSAPAARPVTAPTASDTTVKLNKIRQITAQRTTASKQNVPHFYVTVEVDVENLLALKDQFEREAAGKITVNDFVIRACALALREMPVVNSEYRNGELLQHGAINIGLAVALEDGLTLPVIHNADQLSIRQLGAAARELASKARDNKLTPDELTGATFSISNMGMLDVDVFQAIIVEPNAAILAVSTARKKVVVNDQDELEVRSMMNITASFDHRVVDGAVGARFVNLVKTYLQNPTRMLG